MKQNLRFLTAEKPSFETAYLAVRSKENRLYPDDVVPLLPYLPANHPQSTEWVLRQANCENLVKQLSSATKETSILDLGCGNGWFTRRLAALPAARVLGVDINVRELAQASRLFSGTNCSFAYGDIFADVWPAASFDVIVLNSCIQYFPDLSALLKRLKLLLCKDGIIHILDSPIYHTIELKEAKKRSQTYYLQQGIATMSAHYHHHCWEDLLSFSYQIKYLPNSWGNRIKRKLGQKISPFPWLAVNR